MKEFWIRDVIPDGYKSRETSVINEDPSKLYSNMYWKNAIHVREVDPARDALFDEMLEALKLLTSNWPASRDGMDNEGPRPVGVKMARSVIAKAAGKL